uniref:Uncharacterized protein n=1 Tax=Leptobrachium leishanense TaxID=445787 RepID=A0A8C5R3Y4_9ANUR
MASVDLRDEVTCSICLSIYTDPVTLACGHSFCRICIGEVLDSQGMRRSSCPVCWEKFKIKPELKRKLIMIMNIIAERFQKCSVHKKVLEYYCCEDKTCICVYCRLDGDHRGHQVETLYEAFEKKKEKLRNILQKLTSQRVEAEKRVQSLHELRRPVPEKAARLKVEVTVLKQVSLRISDLIQQLEIKKEELSGKMGDIEKLCDMTDPVTVLQEQESDRADYCDTEEDTERPDIEDHDVGDLDVGLISVILHSGLAGIATRILRQRRAPEASAMLMDVNTASDMLMDVNTAGNHVSISEDLKTVSWSRINQRRPETPERFQLNQVLSSSSFSSGRHYWEVGGSESGGWAVGMAYHSIDRRGWQSGIEENNKSWDLRSTQDNHYLVRRNGQMIQLPRPPSLSDPGDRGGTGKKDTKYTPYWTLMWALFTKGFIQGACPFPALQRIKCLTLW